MYYKFIICNFWNKYDIFFILIPLHMYILSIFRVRFYFWHLTHSDELIIFSMKRKGIQKILVHTKLVQVQIDSM